MKIWRRRWLALSGLLAVGCYSGSAERPDDEASLSADANSDADDNGEAGSGSTGESDEAETDADSGTTDGDPQDDTDDTTTDGEPAGEDTSDSPPVLDERLLHCGAGGGNVVMLDLAQDDTYEVVWEWRAEDAAGWEEPAGFNSVADCKVVEDGTQIALSGNGAVALIEYPSGDVLLHGPLPAAHSVALLPEGRLVGVGANSALIRLYQIGDNDTVIWEDQMNAAHGVVWDRERERVYVIGHDRMRQYALADWDTNTPALEPIADLKLPDRGAHDLSVVPDTDLLVLSTKGDVWTFDRETETFALFDPIAEQNKVKSVDIHPITGRIAWSQGEEEWWATQIQLLSPDAIIPLPDEERLYKVRWFQRETSAAL